MKRTIGYTITAALAAVSFSAPLFADDTFPLSVNESGPVYPQHARVPTGAIGATQSNAPARQVGSATFEVQTPSSVNESAPWLSGTGRR